MSAKDNINYSSLKSVLKLADLTKLSVLKGKLNECKKCYKEAEVKAAFL